MDAKRSVKQYLPIVAGGGWILRPTFGRPRLRFIGLLSVIWLCVSVCAALPLWIGWVRPFGFVEWVCCILIVPEPLLIGLAVFLLLTEKPSGIVEHDPNPDYDIRKLY